jgi:8-amino-7-oxononanoate synthase
VSDERNHASIIDGARLSRAEVEVTPHLDTLAVEKALSRHPTGRRWVITEGYFSMDADSPDFRALRAVCDAYDAALVVDEAHAIGVLGPDGRGVCAEQGVAPDALVGTFGKALGAGGAFVAGSSLLIDWLWNRARSFVFSTGLSPLLAQCALRGLQAAQHHSDLRARAAFVGQTLRVALADLGKPATGYGHIIPVILGSASVALRASSQLGELGVHVQAIRPPTVAPDSSRLRIAASARHTEQDVAKAVAALRVVFGTATT